MNFRVKSFRLISAHCLSVFKIDGEWIYTKAILLNLFKLVGVSLPETKRNTHRQYWIEE